MVNRMERNELESYTAPRRGLGGRWSPNPGPRDSRGRRGIRPHTRRVVRAQSSSPAVPARPKPANPPGPPRSGLADLPPPPARWEGLGRRGPLCGPDLWGPRGPGATKARPAAPAPGPSFSILPRSQVELRGLKRRVNEASVQNDSFLNQTACSVLGKWDAHLNRIHPPPAATAMYLPT